MVSDQSILTFVCSELVSEVLNQPTCKQKHSLSVNEIECAVNSLGWDNSNDLIPIKIRHIEDNIQLTRDQIQHIWMEPFPPCKRMDNVMPQVYIYHQHDWKQTNANEEDHSNQSSPSLYSDITSGLPDGIREFVRQVEHMYDQTDDIGIKTRKDILESLATSEHMPICFPYLIKFAVDKIRIMYRRDGDLVLKLLELIHHILRNKHFDLTGSTSTSGVFDLLVGCFVMLTTDVNLLSVSINRDMEARIRLESIRLVRELLELKIGKYHSIALIEQLIDEYLVPLIVLTRKRLKSKELVDELRDRLRGILDSSCMLVKELMGVNESKLTTKERLSVLG